MWWKILSVLLLTAVFATGMLVPLNSSIERVEPESGLTGRTDTLRFYGYNSFYTRSAQGLRVWLTYKNEYALAGRDLRVESDTVLSSVFDLPKSLPRGEYFTILNASLDDPREGNVTLGNAYKLLRDTTLPNDFDSLWTRAQVTGLTPAAGFRFSNTPINYESIRNLYFHVPMWFVLIALMLASVWHSLKYLRQPDIRHDIRAAAYAEMGLLFGFLGLFTGMLWATYTWGAPWSNDIKQLLTATALLVYVAYFILRASFDEPEKGARIAAVYNIFAFAALIPLLYVVPRIFSSLHPGGQGSPVFNREDLNSDMRLIFYPAIVGWLLLGLWIAQLRIRYKQIEAKMLDL
jgi:heme exporter protein C